jgi:hypothetical protein
MHPPHYRNGIGAAADACFLLISRIEARVTRQ